ncbi:hypothetical protein PPGU16_73860 (plasmid) [Paraburkholderia largidicola]|uniref:Uncharacterized protein n=1 Tax=Paraburkholderia largidicola TaxID=3014751 RepID=A0A7I8C1D5_9BURK|nr:hypothetical protein PPGU16_73860 [Paraburkholderia sp. PGU16]
MTTVVQPPRRTKYLREICIPAVHSLVCRFTTALSDLPTYAPAAFAAIKQRLSVRLWTLRSIRHRDELLKYVLKRVHIAAMVIAHKKGDVTEDVVLAAKAAR